eukprot:TRINITY_DN1243_c0_g1_i1.p1 TRINITY_DN1243_c0_g1~~TRINITY_DN1243_c0_g1_i1.p1  ORF type:complete len:205 (-),score=33.03 TRINITY_DN1243_c0_g1_i1:756-1370(-)
MASLATRVTTNPARFSLTPASVTSLPSKCNGNLAVRTRRRRPQHAVACSSSTLSTASSTADDPNILQGMDHYSRLGLSRSATSEEVNASFQSKMMELTANKDTTKEAADKRVEALKLLVESFNVLKSDEDRWLYDWSIMRKQKANDPSAPYGGYVWPYEADPNLTPGIFPYDNPDPDPEGTTKVGYFFLGWFLLSVVLSLGLPK